MNKEEFWNRVRKGPGCWEFHGAKMGKGYRKCRFEGGRVRAAHHVAWELTYGPIPPEKKLLHECDNPPCVRPSHLKPGTDALNAADRVLKGRGAVGVRNGRAKLNDAKVIRIRNAGTAGVPTERRAASFGVSRKTIWRIDTFRSWPHLLTRAAA